MYGRLIGLRRSSHVTKESFLKSTVERSRQDAVKKATSPRTRFYPKHVRPSFILGKGWIYYFWLWTLFILNFFDFGFFYFELFWLFFLNFFLNFFDFIFLFILNFSNFQPFIFYFELCNFYFELFLISFFWLKMKWIFVFYFWNFMNKVQMKFYILNFLSNKTIPIPDEFFGRFEIGAWFPKFKWPTTKVSRLKWFEKYPAQLYQVSEIDDLLKVVDDPNATFSNGNMIPFLTNRRRDTEESVSISAARDLHVVSELAFRKPYDAFILGTS